MIVAHLSDLHLRDADDAIEFAEQLDCIVARRPDHLVITGDLLDRWNPALLDHTLDLLAARGLLDCERLTIIHGNHDLASSGGHPRDRSDLWRLIFRFWDPPPLIAARKREFYRRITRRAEGVALPPATAKVTTCGLRVATVDTVPAPWIPLSLARGTVTLRHGEGAIPKAQLQWLSRQRGRDPLIVLVHHYPLPAGSFRWKAEHAKADPRPTNQPPSKLKAAAASHARRLMDRWQIVVPMDIKPDDRTRFWSSLEQADALAVLCGHVHRARLESRGQIAVGLNGQSGAAWAGRTVAYYRIDGGRVIVSYAARDSGLATGGWGPSRDVGNEGASHSPEPQTPSPVFKTAL